MIAQDHNPIVVRKLFRDKTTGEFLCSNGHWTHDMKLACDFMPDEQVALRQGVRGLRKMEWVYCFGQAHATPYDFTIELPPVVSGLPES